MEFKLLPVIILFLVFIAISIRQIGRIKLEIWLIMLIGSVLVLITGQISIFDAIKSINLDVILFLFGMFIVGEALQKSGYLYHISYMAFNRAKSVDTLVLLILFVTGLLSSFLMNDTLAIIGTSLVLYFAKTHKISPKLLLITLAFSVTIGSVTSPIGNPQNLLIAINGNIKNPFVSFFKYLFIPTIINFFVTYLILKLFYKKEFHKTELDHSKEDIIDKNLANLSKISLIIIIILIFLKIIIVFLKINFELNLVYIALIAALPIILFSKKRFEIVKHIDWKTLIFFASMFIVMQSVWNSNFFQYLINKFNLQIKSISTIFTLSIILSQFISNVPFVALFIPLINNIGGGIKEMIALAVGSTIAGNLLILGAASNIIIIQNAEKQGQTITFFEFAKVGIPVTIANSLVYWMFLKIF